MISLTEEGKRKTDVILEMASNELLPKEIILKTGYDQSLVYKIFRKNRILFKRKESNYKILVGKKFGKVTVKNIFIDKNDNYRGVAECECDCGNKLNIRCSNLADGTTKSCGCSKKEFTIENNSGKKCSLFKGFEEISGRYWNHLKERAKNRKIEFNITIQDGWNQYIKQNRKCNLSGEKISFAISNSNRGTASLDRINSKMPYDKDNIQWVHKDVNLMKNRFDQIYFIETCKRIYEHRKNSKTFKSQLKQYTKINNVKNNQWKGYGEISGTTWYKIKFGAKLRKMILSISIKEAWELFLKQNRTCAYSGQPLFFGSSNSYSASLDRIDSSIGYVNGNVQWITKDINIMKMGISEPRFLELCYKIAKGE